MNSSKRIFLSSYTNTSLGPLHILPVEILLQDLFNQKKIQGSDSEWITRRIFKFCDLDIWYLSITDHFKKKKNPLIDKIYNCCL